jgi:hypothetical protein
MFGARRGRGRPGGRGLRMGEARAGCLLQQGRVIAHEEGEREDAHERDHDHEQVVVPGHRPHPPTAAIGTTPHLYRRFGGTAGMGGWGVDAGGFVGRGRGCWSGPRLWSWLLDRSWLLVVDAGAVRPRDSPPTQPPGPVPASYPVARTTPRFRASRQDPHHEPSSASDQIPLCLCFGGTTGTGGWRWMRDGSWGGGVAAGPVQGSGLGCWIGPWRWSWSLDRSWMRGLVSGSAPASRSSIPHPDQRPGPAP